MTVCHSRPPAGQRAAKHFTIKQTMDGIPFATATYIRRRTSLRQALGSGLLLFLGNADSDINYAGNAYPFRQDSNFLYFFGLDMPGLAAVIDIDNDCETMFGDGTTLDDIVWTGPVPALEELAAAAGIQRVEPRRNLGPYLQRITRGRRVQFLLPYRPEHRLQLMSLLGVMPEAQDAQVSDAFARAVVNLRSHKTEEEVASLDEAVDLSVRMHLEACRLAQPGVRESDIAAAVDAVAARENCLTSFPTIATVQGQILHNHSYSHTLRAGDLLLLDAGAESAAHYAGDLSTTMPVGGEWTPRQKDICNLQLAMFHAAVETLAVGVPFLDVHLAAAQRLCEGLRDLGLMQGDPAEAAASGAYRLFFPHGVGHMLGLDVHDMDNLGEDRVGYAPGQERSPLPGLSSLRLARPLEPGFVFTIEPGIYFIPELIDRWQADHRCAGFIRYDRLDDWRGFTGFRSEQDYLMTAAGARRLGHLAKPMTADEISRACHASQAI